ncbi:MAG TPA: phospholipase D-like domain-containing protein, partial [Tichowtungia sp.]|nr:phospholipase D-like domain-containing protein [Tichowtungia sp.]
MFGKYTGCRLNLLPIIGKLRKQPEGAAPSALRRRQSAALPALFVAVLCGTATAATTLFTEGFEGSFPPAGWTENSIDQSDTYAFNGTYSAKLSAGGDYLITPAISNATTFIFWSYTTSADPQIVVEHASSPSGPWTECLESPFSGDTEQWNGRWVSLTNSQPVYIRLRKDGTGSLYVDDAAAEDDGAPPANTPPVLDPIGSKSVNEGQVLMFMVSANDADNDPLTYTASNLPPGAVFSTNTITPQFTWAPAGPVGVYTSRFYVTDGITNDFEDVAITVTNAPAPPPLTGTVWNVIYNLPYQSGSGSDYPGQFEIRDALVERIDTLANGDSAILASFTFSAEYGAGVILEAMNNALDRGAELSFIADGDINISTDYGAPRSLRDLENRSVNPLTLVQDGSSSGIMHDKLGLFDYGGSNQWVFVTSWNFTLGASANQWNIALEARSPSLYSVYKAETDELLAERFHGDPAKSHAHDGSTFTLDGSWGTNTVRFAPYPDDTEGGNNAETDIIALIDQAQSNIVFALNKLNREPIRDALIAAANRGVQIQGVMPRSDTDPGGVSDDVYAALTNAVEFLPATAKADYSELDSGQQNLIHAKYMVIDSGTTNAVVIHGSANWTAEALVDDNSNDENTLFLRHNKMAAQFYNHFERITGTGAYSEGNSTLVSWDFEDDNPIADGGIAANATQPVIRVPAPASYSYTDSALSCSGWQDGADTKYWETSFTTIDHTDIKVSSVQLASSTGPADFKLQ